MCLAHAFYFQLWTLPYLSDHTLDRVIMRLISTNDRVICSRSWHSNIYFIFRERLSFHPPLPGQQGFPALQCPLHYWHPAGHTYQRWTALRYSTECVSPNTPIRMSALISGTAPTEWLLYKNDWGSGLVGFKVCKFVPAHPKPTS